MESITDDLESNAEDTTRPPRTAQAFEVLIFLFLIVPSMFLSLLAFQHEKATFAFVAWATMLRDIALVCLILYLIWRNGEPKERIGWSYRGRMREVGVGLLLYIPFFFLAGLVGQVFHRLGLSEPSGPASFLVPKGPVHLVLAFFLVVIVALSEETIFRGYLLLRLSNVTGNISWALIISSIIFALGHGYEGSAGMATVGVMGFIFGLVYLWRKSLVAPITMHFLQDFIGIVLLPLLKMR